MKTHSVSSLPDFDRIVNFRVGADGNLEKRGGAKFILGVAALIRGALTVSTDEGDYIYYVFASYLMRLKVSSDLTARSETVGSLKGAVFSSQDEKVCVFMFAGSVCVLGGGNLYAYNGTSVSVVDGYVPLIQRMTNRLGVGTSFERVNLLTNKVRARFVADGSTRDFRLNFAVTSVDAVYVAGTLIDTSKYTVTINERFTTVTTTSVYTSNSDEEDIIEIWFTLSKDSERSRITSCKRAVAYGGDTDSRIFLYGGNESATLFPSEPSGADSGQKLSFDYFPSGGQITVGDGNLPVTGACRQFDRLALFTPESAYYTYPKDEGVTNGIRFFSFPILPLNSDVGATECGGAVLCENEPYALSQGGLYRFKSTSVRDERLAIRIEPPEYLGFAENFESMTLFVNRLRGEVWCHAGDKVAIYNARKDCWYQFTGVSADGIFNFKGEAAYFSGKSFRIFTDTIHSDGLTAFTAECETKWIELDGATKSASLAAGAIIGSSDSARTAKFELLSDCGVRPAFDESVTAIGLRKVSRQFKAPPSDSPTVFETRARVRRTRHVKLSLRSVSDGVNEDGEAVEVSDSNPLVISSMFVKEG